MVVIRREFTTLLLVLIISGGAFGQSFFQGTVYNPFGIPVSGATVSSGSETVTTDAAGVFYLGSAIQGAGRPFASGHFSSMKDMVRLHGWKVTVLGGRGEKLRIALFNSQGRAVFTGRALEAAGDKHVVDLGNKGGLPAGVYVLRAQIGSRVLTAKAVATGTHAVSWQRIRVSGQSGVSRPEARTAASGSYNVSITAPGLASRSFSLDTEMAMGLEFTLYYPGQSVPEPISVKDTSMEHRFSNVRVSSYPTYPLKWAGNSKVRSYQKPFQNNEYETSNVPYNMIRLDNGNLRVGVAPKLGGRILYVTDKTKTPYRDLFAKPTEHLWKNNHNMMGGMHSNIGGIKSSFPYAENSTGLFGEGMTFNHRAGHFLETHPDGRVSVCMNMRFDYNQREEDCAFMGKFGDRPLLTKVTLEPGKSYVTVSLIAENPHPLRRNDRIWMNAIMKFQPDRYIFPTKWAISHCADPYVDMTTAGSLTASTMKDLLRFGSYFALFPQYGFAGTYYSSASASHLRVSDPRNVPGAKLYAHQEIPEVWSSTNPLFEAPHEFVNAWEPKVMTTRWYMTRGMGEVTFANEYVAIASSGGSFSMTSPCPGKVTVYEYASTASPIIADTWIGPDSMLVGDFTNGVRVVSADGHELCNVKLPLQFEDNFAKYSQVKEMADKYGCSYDVTPSNLDTKFGEVYELEDVTTREKYMSAMASLLAVNNVDESDDAGTLMSMARAAYRCGGFSAVDQYLSYAGQQKPQEANFLKGLMRLEQDSSADFSDTPVEGAYFRALQKVASGNHAGAIGELDYLLSERPRAVRPRLLRAYLRSDIWDAAQVYKVAPSSIELWVVLKELGYPGAEATLTSLLDQQEPASIRADDFLTEITTGKWRAERRYEYNREWYENVPQLPAFPEFLKY